MPFANTEKGNIDTAALRWGRRIQAANEYFEKWEKKFKCERLEEYYEGKQWKDVSGNYEPYVINLVYASIQVKKPSLLFRQPIFHLSPKPQKADFNPEAAFAACSLSEDVLNSFFTDSTLQFADECELGVLDSWFYFGLIEVGYGADWIVNPNAGKPILKSDYSEEYLFNNGEVVKEPEMIPEKEWLYLKRIPAHRFRVGGFDSQFMRRTNWVGYYEFVRIEDIKATPGLINTSSDKLEFANGRSPDFSYDAKEDQISQNGDLIKIWKIWDLRAKEFFILKDNPSMYFTKPQEFERLPLFDLRFAKRRRGWYPIPPVYNWKSPQDEINEAHEMNRAHRRKARSLFQAKKGVVGETEMEKMTSAPDMSIIEVDMADAIKPIQNPTQDASLGTALVVGKDDFNIVSGTASDMRGQSDRTTATQASIFDSRTKIRENTDREIVGKWLSEIGREVIMQVREKFTLPFWIKLTSDFGDDGSEAKVTEQKFALIDPDKLGDFDFDVNISVESLSPIANDEEKKKFFEFIAALQNFPLMGVFPELVRELAFRIGYKNEKVIQKVIQMAQLQAMMQASAAQQQSGGKPNPGAAGASTASQNMTQNATPPAMEQIRQQLGMGS